MGLLNITVSTSIAILYNLFVHHMASIMFKDASYEDKINKSIIFILIAGVIAVIMSNLLFEPTKKTKSGRSSTSVISSGLWLGGILLIITSIFVNWQTLSDDIKLLMIGVTLLALIYYSKRSLEYEDDDYDDVQEVEDLDKIDAVKK